MNQKRAAARDIDGSECKPRSYRRRSRCEFDLPEFCHTYGANERLFGKGTFYPDQRQRLQDLQHSILTGEDLAIATFRGGGKSTEARTALLWALLYGHSRHGVLIGATHSDARQHLEAIKSELQNNDELKKDFPEGCTPVAYLCNSSRKAASQTVNGEHTYIRWETGRLVFPRLPKKLSRKWKAGGSVLQVRSMDGSVRGLNEEGLRPDLILMDDVETRQSVRSQDGTNEIRRKIDTDIAGTESHVKAATKLYLSTIQAEGCVSDELTDPVQRPSYHGIRQQYMKSMPEDWVANPESGLWSQYMTMRRDALFGGPAKSREFYVERREAMDAGAIVAWPEGFDTRKHESAIEKFFAEWADKKEDGLGYIACELQNDPSMLRNDEDTRLTEAKICGRTSRLRRMQIPVESDVVVGFVDVHGLGGYLYYVLLAVGNGFKSPRVLDFGTWPEKQTIGNTYPGLSEEAGITRALTELDGDLMAREYVRDDGLRLDPRFGVDSGAQWATTVYQFCRTHRLWVPTKGDNPKWKDFNTMGAKDAMRGNNWREMPVVAGKYKTRGFMFDANYWKRFVVNRLAVAREEKTALLFNVPRPENLLGIARHILAEYPNTIIEKSTGNEYEQWTQKVGSENHWGDALVGAFVIASISGIQVEGFKVPQRRRRASRIGWQQI